MKWVFCPSAQCSLFMRDSMLWGDQLWPSCMAIPKAGAQVSLQGWVFPAGLEGLLQWSGHGTNHCEKE